MKSHYCGEITSSNLKEEVTICGWVHRRRDHGGVIFLDVRDIKGVCQAVVNPDNKESFILAESIRNEYVCLLYTSPSPRDLSTSRMPSSA